MVPNKSLDVSYNIIAALLHDVQERHGLVFNARNCKLTLHKVSDRLRNEGMGFLTKALPRLGKAFDKAIAGCTPLNCHTVGFENLPGGQLPRFLGEFFSKVLQPNGELLHDPCAQCVRVIREICYLFYKYELPYTDEQEQQVLSKFERTETDLSTVSSRLQAIGDELANSNPLRRLCRNAQSPTDVARKARRILSDLFAFFDPTDIHPRHGPGAVATRQRLGDKYRWRNVSSRITNLYPFDAYYCASLGHVCDTSDEFNHITDEDLPARVILVPKDSRGPRLISCEPVDFQWIQQGLGRAIVELVENSVLTKHSVHFTDQQPNRIGALYGSLTGKYATLDLNEASDRVSVELVRLLFPPHICEYLEACRSLSTELPDHRVLRLLKFAPMGSSLCFPILAITVWALLAAAIPDEYATEDYRASESILVYGDDVIVPTAFAENAMNVLESFGLKINRDKSCTGGLFRESCGMDAFKGVNVTPVRLRTVWSSEPSPESYTSWLAYANTFWDRKYYRTYQVIYDMLFGLYGRIPSDDMHLACQSLRFVPEHEKPNVRRCNFEYQTLEYKVLCVKSPSVDHTIDGWSMLLRFFAEARSTPMRLWEGPHMGQQRLPFEGTEAFSVSQYTSRSTSMLVKRWL